MTKNITPSLVGMYHVCKREMWLHANGINMEQTSDTVYEGKLIGETSYPQRAEKYTELEISADIGEASINAKIDFYDATNRVVHEVKKSDKMEEAHIAQVKLYLFLLEQNGIENPTGILEYPKLRMRKLIEVLSEKDKAEIELWLREILLILENETCPARLTKKTFCRTCSYFDFCYIE